MRFCLIVINVSCDGGTAYTPWCIAMPGDDIARAVHHACALLDDLARGWLVLKRGQVLRQISGTLPELAEKTVRAIRPPAERGVLRQLCEKTLQDLRGQKVDCLTRRCVLIGYARLEHMRGNRRGVKKHVVTAREQNVEVVQALREIREVNRALKMLDDEQLTCEARV